jgi:hypothetical protein
VREELVQLDRQHCQHWSLIRVEEMSYLSQETWKLFYDTLHRALSVHLLLFRVSVPFISCADDIMTPVLSCQCTFSTRRYKLQPANNFVLPWLIANYKFLPLMIHRFDTILWISQTNINNFHKPRKLYVRRKRFPFLDFVGGFKFISVDINND